MARPTKAEQAKRKEIIRLELFKRDNKIYTNFENISNGFTNLRLSHLFCTDCSIRGFINSCDTSTFKRDFKKEITFIDKIEKLKELEKIDKFSYYYYCFLHLNKKFTNRNYSFKSYEVNNTLELQHIVNALGAKYALDVPQEDFYMSIHLDSYPFTEEEKEKLLKYCIDEGVGKTFINHESIDIVDDTEIIDDMRLNRVNIEIDLTKPKEEILKYISIIKDDYDLDRNNIPTIYSLLGANICDYKCELDKCDIFKLKNPKPINGRLADILFIYDCRKIGLNDDYIKDEINRYWQDVKGIFKENFTSSSLINYYNFALEYIDNQKYKSFISGYDLS